MNTLRETGEQLIPAIAYGDAAGLPVETWSAEKIEHEFGWLNRLVCTDYNPYFAGSHEPGTWSDDTQLTIAVAEALIAAGGFDLNAQAEAHVRAYYEAPKTETKRGMQPRGWGGSTVNSVKRLINGVSPQHSGEQDGSGNGVLMKMAPLAYWHAVQEVEADERYTQYDQLTGLTHDSDVARLTTRLHGDVLDYLIRAGQDESQLVENFAEFVQERAAYHQTVITSLGKTVSDALVFLDNKELLYNPDKILAETDRKGFFAPQTLALAYGAFLHLSGDFHQTVYEAVNLGGDTDSIGSIAASMVVCIEAGRSVLPEDAGLLLERERLSTISTRLAKAALST